MPHQVTESANNVLDSLHRRFVDETYGVNGLFFESIFKTREQLANLLIRDQSEELLAKSRIVHEGIYDWLEALAKLAHTYAGRLVAIIRADPQLCSSENPAQWIRLWLEERLQKHLRQGELNIERRARLDWQRRADAAWESVPEKKRRRALDLARTAWESLPEETRSIRTFEEHFLSSSSSDNAHAKWSRVESWLRRVVDGLPDFDRSSTGYEEPWLATPWCNEEIWIKIRLKKHRVCPDRLTREQTSRLIHRFEDMLAARLDYVLGVEDDEARITFAQSTSTVGNRNDRSELSARVENKETAKDRRSIAGPPTQKHHFLILANRKLADPDKYPSMTAKEVMACLQLSKSAVYEHRDLDEFNTGSRARRFTTKSVLTVKNSPPR